MLDDNCSIAYYILEEAIIKTSKIHNLFIQYPNNTYFSGWNPLENGYKIHKNCYFNNNRLFQQLKAKVLKKLLQF
jgi:hypothetical protein